MLTATAVIHASDANYLLIDDDKFISEILIDFVLIEVN